jgi:phage FluMu gp28-like protein
MAVDTEFLEAVQAALDGQSGRRELAERAAKVAHADPTPLPWSRSPEPNLLDALMSPGVLPPREANAIKAWSSTFYPFQREWLFEPSRYALCLKSRQIGMSHTTAAMAVLWAAAFGETTTVISIGQREANEVLDKAKRHAEILVTLGSEWAKCGPKVEEMNFANGGRILALPSSTGGRSFSGNVFLDELAYLQDPARAWDGAAAVAMHGGRIRAGSTPNGVGNLFHGLWTDPKQNRGWAKHEVSIHKAIDQGMRLDLDDLWKMAHGDPRVFAQMFECSFLDGELQYIPTELVDAAVDYVGEWVEGTAFAGLDIGLENDLSSLTIGTLDKHGHVWERETRVCKRTDWDAQQAMILASFENWGWKLLCVDSTGLGAVPAQLLVKALGAHRVLPVPFTMQTKEILATGMYDRFATRSVHIRPDDKMKKDVCSLRRIVTSAGNVRYDAPRTADGHADRAWSLALMLHACSPLAQQGKRVDYGYGDFRNS